jgi:hypothetical protein
MSIPRPADLPSQDALRHELESWLNQQNQALLEEVMATWQEALARFRPDSALLARLSEASPSTVVLREQGNPDQAFSAALDLVEEATSQGDLLKRLLDGLAPLVERSALYVLKQGLASPYAHRGFDADASTHTGAGSVVPPPELEALIQGHARLLDRKGPGYSALVSPLSPIEAAEMAILPLRHKRKTVALLLVDSGLRQTLDHPVQVRALVLAASATLASLAAAREDLTPPPMDSRPNAPTQVVTGSIEPPPSAELDPRTRAAAERLARVLVGDVELYFPAKVAQAKSQGNLYGHLREELDRSRATLVERFGEDTENRYRIFTNTVIHQLCDGDASKLGPAPWA